MKKYLMAAAAVGMAVGMVSAAPALRQLPWQMGVKYGATHVIEFTHEDLTQTATNTVMVFTNTVAAPASVKFEGMLLDVPFDSTTVTNPFTMTLSCGAGAATTGWLNAREVAADGTEIRSSFGGDYTATVALALTTNQVVIGEGTSTVYFVTGATGTSTVASPLVQEQTSTVAIVTTFGTAGANRNHAELNRGRVRLFFRIWKPGMD